MNKTFLKSILLFLILFFWQYYTNAQHDTIVANDLLEKALDLHYDGDYKAARKPLQKVLALRQKHYPSNDSKVEDLYYWLGRNEEKIRNGKKALEYYWQGWELAMDREGAQSSAVAYFYLDIGNVHDILYDVATAKKYYDQALSIFKEKHGPESSPVGNAYMNIGIGQGKMGNYLRAKQFYKKAFDIFQKSSEPNSPDFYRIYINQCYLFYSMGNYDRSLDYGEKALKIKLMHYDTLHPSVHKYFALVGDNYQAKGEYAKALPYYKTALRIAEKTRGKNHPETAGALGEIANIYGAMGQLDKALKLNKRAVKIQEKGLAPTHPYLVAGYKHIGKIYKDKKEFDKALDFYQNAIDKYQRAVFVPKHLIAETLSSMAEIYFEKGNFEKALLVNREAMGNIANDFVFTKNEDYENPPLIFIQAEEAYLELLRSKAIFLQARYKRGKKQMDLEEALKTSELAIKLIEKIRRNYLSESAIQFLNDHTASVYEKAIEQAFELYLLTKNKEYLYKAFNFSEKSKASILWQSINSKYALEASGIPAAQLDSLRSLESQIAALEEQFEKETHSEGGKKIQDQIFDLKRNQEQLILGFEKYNPQYYQLKYPSRNVDLGKMVKAIPDHKTALVEYFYTKEALYIFVLSQKGLTGFKSTIPTDFSEKILALRNRDIQNIAFQKEDNQAFVGLLNELYNLTISPIQSEIKALENLIVIPHGVLQYLSFESLVAPTENTDFRKLNYLLRNYNIQYNWAAALWANVPQKINDWELDFLGFAPEYNKANEVQTDSNFTMAYRENLASLHHSLPELEGANNYFSGKIFSAARATEARFINLSPQSRIIHLATHAVANDLYPMQSGLFFSEQSDSKEDGFLQISEIYNLKLSADLALMSACNTGFGQFSEGEGIMSLGRAFLYAGCKSVVMSLWLANDESTSKIVQDFYKYAAQGFHKNKALRKAKLDYLDQADPLTAHPYFWANLVAVGDMEPLQKTAFNSQWWVFVLAGLVILLGGIWWSKKRTA